jgi:hypothetical protein
MFLGHLDILFCEAFVYDFVQFSIGLCEILYGFVEILYVLWEWVPFFRYILQILFSIL